MNTLKQFFYDEDGLGTIEVIVLIIVLIGVALLFQDKIRTFVEDTLIHKIEESDTKINIEP